MGVDYPGGPKAINHKGLHRRDARGSEAELRRSYDDRSRGQ